MEESYALGVLGASGRGACEAAGLQPGQVEVIVASMGTTLASVGGFCVGHHEVGLKGCMKGRPPCTRRCCLLPTELSCTAAAPSLLQLIYYQQGLVFFARLQLVGQSVRDCAGRKSAR